MYKIIFIDDELITLRMLESAIDWEKHGIRLCGTASDGEEGIALFRQVEPDIVIADIRMPRLNGIEFARAIRETRRKVKILLLSAYAEFEYAQSALTYQISDYLLKPLDEDKLDAAIARIVQELDRDHTVSSTIESYQLERAEKQLQQFFLPTQRGSETQVTPLPDEIRATFAQADTLMHLLRVTETADALQANTDVEGIRLFFKDRLGSHAAVLPITPVELIVLASSNDLQSQLRDMLITLRLREQPVIVGLSSIAPPFNLTQAYQQAETALYECFYSGEDVCAYAPRQSFSPDMRVKLADFEAPIAELVEQGKSSSLIEHLQGNLADLTGRRIHPALLYDFAFDLLNWIRIAAAKQYPTKPLSGLVSVDRYRLRMCATQEIFVASLTKHLQSIGETVNQLLVTDPGYYIVQRAKDYARAHYAAADFSLQDAADYVGLSKNHLSRVFHETTGMKFWDYVTQLRIEKAKELLKKSNCSNYEICREIGYESEFYFSKIFKRVVGMAAQEFRRL